MGDTSQDKDKLKEFDPTTELWERITDDIADRGAPCMETIEKLVDESCYRPPAKPKAPETD